MEHMPWKLVDLNISAGDIDVIKNLDVMTLSLTSLDLDDFWRYDMIGIEYWDDKLYIHASIHIYNCCKSDIISEEA